MANILIAGCGYIGAHLGLRLAEQGHRVWGLRTHPENLPAPIIPWKANLNDPGSLRPMPAVFEVIFFTAGAANGSEEAYRQVYLEGTAHLLAALEQQSPPSKRLLFTSSTAVYEQQDGAWVDETSLTEPTRHTGRIMLEAEALFHQAAIPATVVRLGGIYGPGRTHLLDQARHGTVTVTPGRAQYLNLIHRDDVTGALAYLMGLSKPEPLYVAVDNTPMERTDLLRWMARQLGLPEPAVLEASEAPALVRGGNRRCSNTRLRDTGYVFHFPTTEDGYRALIRP